MKKLSILLIAFFSLILGVQLKAVQEVEFEFKQEFINKADKDYNTALNETTKARYEAETESDPGKKEELEKEYLQKLDITKSLRAGIEKYKNLEKRFNTASETEKNVILEEAKKVEDDIVTLQKDVEKLASLVEEPVVAKKPELSLVPEEVTKKNISDFKDLTNVSIFTKLGRKLPLTKDRASQKLLRLNRLAEDMILIASERAKQIYGDQYNTEWLEATQRFNTKPAESDQKVTSAANSALASFRSKIEKNNKSGSLKDASLDTKNKIFSEELKILQENYKKVIDTINSVNKIVKGTTILPDLLENAFFPKAQGESGYYKPEDRETFEKLTNLKSAQESARSSLSGKLPRNYYNLSTLATNFLLEASKRYNEVIGKRAGTLPINVDFEIRKIKRFIKEDPTVTDAYAYATKSFFDQIDKDNQRFSDVPLTKSQEKPIVNLEFDELNKHYSSVIKALREYDKQLGVTTNLPDELSVKTLEDFAKGVTSVEISGPPGG